ncbi:MAG TPA: alpha/beta hydrolase, partial [Burkholderiaceae bacterium]|nr:alpha/beta hydrolase [Burkholderiaceae bacterium]
GIEDTNALALAFPKIAALNSRPLTAPSKTYIIGISMGGHVTAAAMEDETYATANNKQKYNAALPMCGVVGDAELFNTFAAEQLTAQTLSGLASNPYDSWGNIKATVTADLFTSSFPAAPITPTALLGQQYYSVLENLTGGDRPIFDIGYADGGSLLYPYFFFGVDPINLGLLTKQIYDTNEFNGPNATRPYTVDGNTAASIMLNSSTPVLTAETDVNRLRADGLRWLPLVNGQFHAPVVTLHTLGDLFVPFHMEQVYRARANANGNGGMLVQRAIRGATHCDFTIAEQVAAFDAMIAWESNGTVPAGDDVATPATVAASTYGCTYTNNSIGPDDTSASFNALRQVIVAAHPCPSN